MRLTGRGALLVMFVLFLSGLLASGWLGWGPLAGGTFVAASALAAARTQRGDLLAVTVSPPALFGGAVLCVKALTASGNVLLSAGAGTLITLANTAPWLLAGTALSLVIAFARGLRGTAAALGRQLHGLPPAPARHPSTPPWRPAAGALRPEPPSGRPEPPSTRPGAPPGRPDHPHPAGRGIGSGRPPASR